MYIVIMDKNQLAKEILVAYINEDGSIKELTGSSVKAIKELFEQWDITVSNPQDLENLISSIDELNLSWPEKLALKNLWNTYKEQYPSLLDKSIQKKNEKVNAEMEARELLNQKRWNISSTDSSEQLPESGMSEELIQQAINRNAYISEYNNKEEIREVCKKINYTRESLGNGREKHTLNGKVFSFPKKYEFTIVDMRDNNRKYTMDIVSEEGKKKYEKFQNETGINKLSPEKVYGILWEIAASMNILDTIDYNFFSDNSEKAQSLLQMFRNLTWFEWIIPLNITNNWKVIESLYSISSSCWFKDSYNDYVAFLSGL